MENGYNSWRIVDKVGLLFTILVAKSKGMHLYMSSGPYMYLFRVLHYSVLVWLLLVIDYGRRNYRSFSTTAVKSQAVYKPMVTELSRKCKADMRELASSEHDSILRDTRNDSVWKQSCWNLVLLLLLTPKIRGHFYACYLKINSEYKTSTTLPGRTSNFCGSGTSKHVMWVYDFPQENMLFRKKEKILVIQKPNF